MLLGVSGAGEFKPDWTRPTEQQLPVIMIYNKLIGKGEWEVGRGAGQWGAGATPQLNLLANA